MDYCTKCFSGLNTYISSRLKPYKDNTSICYACGTVYDNILKDSNGYPEIKKDQIESYKNLVYSRLKNLEKIDEYNILPIIPPIVWTLFDEAFDVVTKYTKTFMITDSPLFTAFGLHDLATILGVKIGNASYNIEEAHELEIKNIISKGMAVTSPKFLFLTIDFDGKELINYSKNNYIVLCIRDLRDKIEKKNSLPLVISLI